MAPVRWLLGVLLVTTAPSIEAAVVVKQGTQRATEDLVAALQREGARSGSEVRVVDLTGSFSADLARVGRAADGETAFFAVGPNATVLAGTVAEGLKKARLVSLAVPNPEKLDAPATYIAFYPPLDAVFRFLAARFHARSVGFLYSPGQNAGVAATFEKAASARGIRLVPIEARSSGELIRHLKEPLLAVDVLVVPVDPLLFDRDRLRIVITASRAAGKPAVGFLADLPQLGFTGVLLTGPEATARAAWKAVRESPAATGNVVEVKGPLLYVTADAPAVTVDDGTEKATDAPRK
jgi:hypothetical protein